ncbi:head maturation protease, ClpP-related [Streptomyces syringium]|uniref:head maturation protease, ClpP-related n=1 Tax=Streptomyces syringium TaxID=76729 RepID=UPI0033DD0602
MPIRDHVRTARPRAALRQGRNDWYRITNLGSQAAEVVIYDEIGYWGVTAEDFMSELRGLDVSEITLRVNSPGGEIFDGIAIHNLLRSHRAHVTTYVDSLAASIASVIALAGDRVVMQPHSQMMIHDGSGLVVGNAADMREMADLLDRQSDNIAAVYAEKSGGTPQEWRERMRAETWYTAAEAVEAGLADEVAQPRQRPDEGEPADNSWDLSIFRYAGRAAAPAPVAASASPGSAPDPGPVPAVDSVAQVTAVEPEDDHASHHPAEDDESGARGHDEPDTPTNYAGPGTSEPADTWAELTARLTDTPASPTQDDEFARLREALL